MKAKISLLFVVLILTLGCQQNKSTNNPAIKKGMIKVTILYPGGEGKTFDIDYYVNKHIPLVKSLLGDSMKLTAIDKGIAGGIPGSPVPYLAIGYLYFETVSASMKSHREKIVADIANYTNIQPVIQISEVLQ